MQRRTAVSVIVGVTATILGCALVAYAAGWLTPRPDSTGATVAAALAGLLSLLVAAVALSWITSGFAADALVHLFSSSGNAGPAGPCTDAEQLAEKGHVEGAIRAYETIALRRASDPVPYVRLIEFACTMLGNGERARAFYPRGMSLLSDAAAKRRLESMYRFLESNTDRRMR